MQVGRAADARHLTGLAQCGGHCDGVGRLTATVEVDDGAVDGLMGRSVEVALAEGLDDVSDGIFTQQHRTKHALLSLNILRREPIEARTVVTGLTRKFGDAHRAPLEM